MIASELAKLLMENPDAEVLFMEQGDKLFGEIPEIYYEANYDGKYEKSIPELYEDDILNRPDEVVIISMGTHIKG